MLVSDCSLSIAQAQEQDALSDADFESDDDEGEEAAINSGNDTEDDSSAKQPPAKRARAS